MLYIFQVTTPAVQTLYNVTPIVVFGGQGTEPGMLKGPRGVAVNHLTDVIYVADQGNQRVCEFNSSGHVISCMSGYRTADDVTVPFKIANDVSVMTDGRMIICDEHRVMLMYTNYTIIHIWGSLTAGQGLGQFNIPVAIASDGDLIYVADRDNERIQVLNVTSFDVIVEFKVTEDDPSVSYGPRGVAVDPQSGDIFVTGDSIIIYNRTGHYIRKVTESDMGVAPAILRQITLYRDRVYVSYRNNDCIHIMSHTGSNVQTLGHTGTCPGCFQGPWGVAVHSETGHLIVTDGNNHNVQIFILV